jgi:predicted nucleic acid-binding protein
MKDIKIHIATAGIAEVYRAKKQQETPAKCLDDFMSLLDEELLVPIELDRITAIEAHKLCRKHPALRPFDAIHLACALSAECDYLLTWDKKLRAITHDKIKIDRPCIYAPTFLTEPETASPEEQHEWNLANPKQMDPNDMMFLGGTGI